METDRLRYFCIIAETGSMTSAAQLLNVSHSGLSKAMSVLQNELNMQLLRPLGRGLELTPAGQEVYAKSKKLLEQIEQLKQSQNLSTSNKIRVGMSEVIGLGIAQDLALTFKEHHFLSDFYELDSGETETRILNGDLDFAIGFIPFPHKELEYLKIKKMSLGVYCKQPDFLKMKIEKIPFVVPNHEIKNNPLSIKSRDSWPADVPRNIQFGASSLSLALKIVDAGLAAIYMPSFLGHGRYQEIEVGKAVSQNSERDIFLVKKKNIEETKTMKLAAKVIRTNLKS
ncbi:MAG: LysR family transcriptional regulator [Pseudobdellovibrio sp.]